MALPNRKFLSFRNLWLVRAKFWPRNSNHRFALVDCGDIKGREEKKRGDFGAWLFELVTGRSEECVERDAPESRFINPCGEAIPGISEIS